MKNLVLAALLCMLSTETLSAAARPVSERVVPAADEASARGAAPVMVRKSLKQISNRNTLYFKSAADSLSVTFGGNSGGIVTRAVLHLQYTFSPALIPGESHLKITVNDETVGVIPATRENAGRSATQSIEIDPRLLADINHIGFEFSGHYTHDREDPTHNSLWMEISGSSQLELTVQKLATVNNLALLPYPFFDPKDFDSRLSLQFVFPSDPGKSMLNAAGIISSWFGKLAAWRGTRFPARLDSIQEGNAIVFATVVDRPGFLGQYPKIEGSALEMMTNPVDGHSKLLLVLGRDGKDLVTAAQALVLGNAALSGHRVSISELKFESARQPYDAPNWVRTDRPVKLGELVSYPQELQASGRHPEDIRVRFRIPPDLFTWRSDGVPVDLKYRYTPDSCANDLRLRVSINDELVRSFGLPPSGGAEKDPVRPSGTSEGLPSGLSQKFLLPAFKLAARNELQFGFTTGYPKENNCKESVGGDVQSMIDADSQLDFTGFPHYAEMPNLNFFATSGFPFTRYADLSQTAVVMPERPTTHDIETMLALLGRMGESTGYPATRFKVAGSNDEALLRNADLLVIGASLKQGLLAGWAEDLPVDIGEAGIRVSQPERSSFSYSGVDAGTKSGSAVLAEQKISGNGPLAAMLGFESPLSSERSVVAIVATQPQQLPQVIYALEDNRLTRDIRGSAVLVHPGKIESFLVGPTYFVGDLPLLTFIRLLFANHPVLLAITAVLALLIFALALSRALEPLASGRFGEEN